MTNHAKIFIFKFPYKKMILEMFVNLDKTIITVIQTYGLLVYPLLFAVIFLETGLVIAPFLPGDSLLFAAGTIASRGLVNIWIIWLIAVSAAILGDSVNYLIGKIVGNKIAKSRFIKKEYLERTQHFYDKYGGKTIIIARFIPIIRTFAPFVAGIGKMEYKKFIGFNIVGGLMWTSLLTFAGFFFGNLPLIKENFSIAIIAIIFISLIPLAVEIIKNRKKK
jgi:membrane-associated protein